MDKNVDLMDAWLRRLVARVDTDEALSTATATAAAADARAAQVQAYSWNLTRLATLTSSVSGARAWLRELEEEAAELGPARARLVAADAWFAFEAERARAVAERRRLEGEVEAAGRAAAEVDWEEERRAMARLRLAVRKKREAARAMSELAGWAATARDLEEAVRLLGVADKVGGGGVRARLNSKSIH